MTLGEALKQCRKGSGLTQTGFAATIGAAGQSTISAWETGRADPPSCALVRIRQVHGWDLVGMVAESEPRYAGEPDTKTLDIFSWRGDGDA